MVEIHNKEDSDMLRFLSKFDLKQEVNSLKIEIRQLKQELNDKCGIIEQYELNPHRDFIKILKDNDVESIQINL